MPEQIPSRVTTHWAFGSVLLLLSFAAALLGAQGAEAQQVASLQGYGDAKFGMRIDEVGRVVGRLEFDKPQPGGQKVYVGPSVRVRHLMFDSRYIFDGDGKLFTVNLVHPMEQISFDRCKRLFDDVSGLVSDRYGAPTFGPKVARKPFERAENLVWTTSKAVARFDFGKDSGVAVRMAHHDLPRVVGVAELQCHVVVQYGTMSGGSDF